MVAVVGNSAGGAAVKKAIWDAFKSAKENAEKNPSRFGGELTPLVPHSEDAKK